MKKILTTISLLLFVTIAVALEYKPGKKIPAKEGVVGFGLELFNVIAPLLTSLTISSLTCCFTSFLTTSLMRPNNTSDFDIIDTF